jgi:hypothetical protein
MSEVDALKAGEEKLNAQEATLSEKLLTLKAKENEAMTAMREIGQQLRKVRAARVEVARMIRDAENPSPPVSPEVQTIIQSVVATAQATTGPPSSEAQ